MFSSLNVIANASINILIKHAPEKAVRGRGNNGPNDWLGYFCIFYSDLL